MRNRALPAIVMCGLLLLCGGLAFCTESPTAVAGNGNGDNSKVTNGVYELVMRAGVIGKNINLTPVALFSTKRPPLSESEKAVMDRAISRLLEACKDSPEAVEAALEASPSLALKQFGDVFDKAKQQSKVRIAVLAARRGEPIAAELVIRALLDPNDAVNGAARTALEAAGKPVPAAAALAAAKNGKSDRKILALSYVAEKADAATISLLRDYLQDRDEAVRAKALGAIILARGVAAEQGVRSAVSDGSPKVRQQALRQLDGMKKLSTDDLLLALKGADEQVTRTVLELTPRTDNAVIRTLALDAIRAKSAETRSAGVTALGRMGNTSDIEVITGMLNDDKSVEVRAAAARALGTHPGLSSFAELLAKANNDKESEASVRRAAGEGLAAAGDEGVRAALQGLAPANTAAWGGLVEALSAKGTPDGDLLVEVVKMVGAESTMWEKLADAGASLTPADRRSLLAVVLERGSGEGQAKAIDSLAKDATPESRRVLLDACAYPNVLPKKKVGTDQSGPQLAQPGDAPGTLTIQIPTGGAPTVMKLNLSVNGKTYSILLTDKLAGVWELLLTALAGGGEADSDTAKASLVRTATDCLANPTPEIRGGAVRLLARLASPTSLDAIVTASNDTERSVRLASAEALRSLPTTDAVKILDRMSASSDSSVREAVAQTASAIGGQDALPVLDKLAAAGSDARLVANGGLVRYPERRAEAVRVMAEYPSHEDGNKCVDMLSTLPPADAAGMLGDLAAKAVSDDLASKAITKLWELAVAGSIDTPALETALGGVLRDGNGTRKTLTGWALSANGSTLGLEQLVVPRSTDIGLSNCALSSSLALAVQDGKGILPSSVQIRAAVGFRTGSSTSFGYLTTYRTTHYTSGVIPAPRKAERFADGDRWPLDRSVDLGQAVPESSLLAIARFDDPRVETIIRDYISGRNRNRRLIALWAMAIRDDRQGLENLLNSRDSEVAKAAINALRLLGHRASVIALGPKVEGSTEAALAVVEVGLGLGRPSGEGQAGK
ncbi:MAG: HEAT repeat domain-containing protein [Armatimonadota bacterium]|nr:HEAT repeat domain-containing protein [Armatimonadota bacterium]